MRIPVLAATAPVCVPVSALAMGFYLYTYIDTVLGYICACNTYWIVYNMYLILHTVYCFIRYIPVPILEYLPVVEYRRNSSTTPVSESALRYDKKVLQENFFRSYTLSRGADLLVHTADLECRLYL